MPNYVFDASAVIALLHRETGVEFVESVFERADNVCSIHGINACEVYYEYARRRDAHTAKTMISELVSTGLIIRDDLDQAFWQDVGDLKISPGRMSLADCCGLALARRERASFLTADHHEMDRIANLGIINIEFIR